MARVNDVRELDEQLDELVKWERFAIHLGMSMSDINMIDRDKSDTANKKLAVYDKCLKSQTFLTWETVVQALDVIGENTLAKKVKLAKSICTKKDENNSIGHSRVCVSSSIANKLAVLNKSFIDITENLKRLFQKSLKSGSITMKYIISRTMEEPAFMLFDEFRQVTETFSYFEAIKSFYSFLDCDLIVCLATSLFVSSSVAIEANEYEKKRDIFMESTDVMDLHGALEVYFPHSLDEGTSVRLTVVVQQSWGRQKLWRAKELIRFLFGLEKNECQWFRVRPGSVVLDFLFPQRLIMFAIVQCVNKLEFLQLMGVIAIRVGTILVMRKTEEKNFSFQNSFIEACKLEKTEYMEFLLQLATVEINKPSENLLVKQKEMELSYSQKPMIDLLLKVHFEFSLVANAFMRDIIDNEMIELSTLMSFVHENRPSLASFFSSVSNKADFFNVAQHFFDFLSLDLLVTIERVTCEFFSDISFQMENFATRIESIKKVASVSCLEITLGNIHKSILPQIPGTISVTFVLSNEWLACSLLIFEKLIRSIFFVFKHPEELRLFKIAAKSQEMIVQFYLPECLQEQLIESSKQKTELMKALGIGSLKIGKKSVLDNNCDDFTFEKAFSEAKEDNNVEVLKFLSEVQEDLLSSGEQALTDENNNLTFECVPDSTVLMISSAQGNLKIVKFLLDNGADPNIETKAKATALMYAIYSGDYNVAQLLLKHSAHMTDTSGLSMLHVACHLGNAKILKLLLQQKPDVNVLDSVGATPLFISCKMLHVSLVPLLLKAQADPNIPDNNGTTPLSIAVRHTNCLPIVQCLLKAHADPNLQDRFGMTAIFFAISINNFKVFECLFDASANPCIETVFGSSAFHFVCRLGHIKMLKRILKHTAKPNFQLSNGMTPLYSACVEGQIEVVKLLIKANADPNIPCNSENMTPLCAACVFGNLKLVKILLNSKANPNYHDNELYPVLCGAIQSNCLEIVDILLKANANPDARAINRLTPLHCACLSRNLDITKSLLRAKANPNVQDISGATPLIIAILAKEISPPPSCHNHTAPRNLVLYEIVDALLEAGADPNIPNDNNATSLHTAAHMGMTDIVARLLQQNATPNIQTTDGVTPLHNAAFYAHIGVINVLLCNHADPNILVYENEMAPLHIVCSNPDESLEMVEAFLSSSKTDPNILDAKHFTPLHYAASNIHLKILRCLIQSNANPNIQNQDGATPLFILCSHGASYSENNILVEMVNILLKANADPNVQSLEKMLTPLHLACFKGWLEIVNSLLKAKANPNIQNNDGSTPLLSVLQAGKTFSEDKAQTVDLCNQYEIVDALLEAKADPNIADKRKCTPLHVAAGRGKTDIVARLLKGKANANVQAINNATPLHLATCFGHLEVIKLLLREKVDPNKCITLSNCGMAFSTVIIDNAMAPLHIACSIESLEIVKVLLNHSNANPNILDDKQSTPLHYAVRNANTNIMQCLIALNANPNIQNEDGFTPLHLCCHHKRAQTKLSRILEMVNILLQANADPNMQTSRLDMTSLHLACLNEYLEIIMVLLQAKADPNVQDFHGSTPLVLVLLVDDLKSSDIIEGLEESSNQYEIVDALLQAQANPDIANKEGCTALFLAASKGKTDIVARLLRGKADPNTKKKGVTPLHIATIGAHLEVVKVLLKEKADPNILDYTNGIAPLHIACCPKGSQEMAQVILSCPSTDPNFLDSIKETPLHYAVRNANTKIMQCLIALNANPNIQNEDGFTPLHLCCHHKRAQTKLSRILEMVNILLQANADPNMQTSCSGATSLHFACSNGYLEIIMVLLKAKADPNVQDFHGTTPLVLVLSVDDLKSSDNIEGLEEPSNQYEIVDALLQAQANPNIADKIGCTALFLAASKGATDIVARLLIGNFEADPNTKIEGMTPLHIATIGAHLEVVKVLLKEKADPNVQTSDKMLTPLHFACCNGWLQIVKSLLKAKGNPNIQDRYGFTPLLLMLTAGLQSSEDITQTIEDPLNQYEIVDALLKAQADPNITDKENSTPLHAAANSGKADIVARLLQGKANPNIQTIKGATPLYCATVNKHLEIIKLLLRKKAADPNKFINVERMTPLHIACMIESLEIVEVLLNESKADPNMLDAVKESPLHYAAKNVNTKIMQCLIASNANPNIQNEDGFTPLHFCCHRERTKKRLSCIVEIVTMLLQANADPNVQTSLEMLTPLHYACLNGYLEIVAILLKKRADPNAQGSCGSTPLVLMLSDVTFSGDKQSLEDPPNQYEIVDALLQAQADPNIADKIENCAPLVIAASKGKNDIVARLLRGKADPNIQTKEGVTPLHVATSNGNLEVVEILLKEKADPNILDYKNGMAPLHIACSPDGSLEMAQVILSCPNTDPDILDVKHQAPLHYAVSKSQPKLLQCLIASNANPNIRDGEDFTPLHTACVFACCTPEIGVNIAQALEMAGILLEAKADPHMDSKFGTAFQIATRGQNVQLLLILFVFTL